MDDQPFNPHYHPRVTSLAENVIAASTVVDVAHDIAQGITVSVALTRNWKYFVVGRILLQPTTTPFPRQYS